MTPKQRLLDYLLLTGFVWIYYALVLPPVFFIPFFGWGMDEIIKWWVYGSPIEFLIAYPLAKMVVKIQPKITKFVENVK